jgi:hypothetical protein
MGPGLLLADMERDGGHLVILLVRVVVAAIVGVTYGLMQVPRNRAGRVTGTSGAQHPPTTPNARPRSKHE